MCRRSKKDALISADDRLAVSIDAQQEPLSSAEPVVLTAAPWPGQTERGSERRHAARGGSHFQLLAPPAPNAKMSDGRSGPRTDQPSAASSSATHKNALPLGPSLLPRHLQLLGRGHLLVRGRVMIALGWWWLGSHPTLHPPLF